MAQAEPVKSKSGCFPRLMFISLLLVSGLLALAIVLVLVPQDLSDIEGRGGKEGKAPRNLKVVLKESVERGYELTLSEEEINRWFATHVVMKQQGFLAGQVKHLQVLVRLQDKVAELVLVREWCGKTLTFSVFLQIECEEKNGMVNKNLILHGGSFGGGEAGMMRGGRFGRLVVPQGYLHLLMPSLRSLAAACSEEIALAFEQMSVIRIEEGRLILNPLGRDKLLEEGMK